MLDTTNAAPEAAFNPPPSARSLLADAPAAPPLALIAGDRVHFGDQVFTVLGEQNETWARYAVLTHGVADNAKRWPVSLVETDWTLRLFAILVAIAKAASVDADIAAIEDLCEAARMRRVA